MRTVLISVTFLSAIFVSARAYAAGCPNSDAMIAEDGTDQLKTWEDLHALFQKFPACDDGAIAEGYSDFVARALASQWTHLHELQALIAHDPSFRDFVLHHIDATANHSDLISGCGQCATALPDQCG